MNLILSDSTNDYGAIQAPESRHLILHLIACNWHASSPVLVAHFQKKSVNITQGSLGYLHSDFDKCQVPPIVSTFIQQVHRPDRPLVRCVRIQMKYSGLYDALIFFCDDLVTRGAHG
ncbi:hypothetical protein AZE42_06227 [Rhizopogon vesiculosus]|uniref:Uncharacterized protein n=1 Tax=Rhizopogon vesiculosus TaxID=180088 RepID=A0A1J8PZJ8_9AGAM|nr:hypothetical protein AZE42_06227 [Rhizopogon vesiculosus]